MSNIDYIKDFRDSKKIQALAKLIQKEVDRPINIMEVCGGHTHTIMKYGLKQLLPPEIDFIHGPGCPVCIMPKERIDHAIALAQDENNIVATLGDMIRVPGSKSSLQKERAKGKNIKMVYAPFDVLKIAKENIKLARLEKYVKLIHRDISEGIEEKDFDAGFIDVKEPWKYIKQLKSILKKGAPIGFLVPTVNQILKLLEELEKNNFLKIEVKEILLREYKPVVERFRPEDRMVAHTGYLIFARNK